MVLVRVQVDSLGHARGATVVSSSGATTQNHTVVAGALNAEAVRSAMKATYEPKVVHCKAVQSTFFYSITFSGGP